MNKLKRIISLAFIIAFALSQFEYVKAESVEADMTDAKNAETVVASEETEHEELNKDAEAKEEEAKEETVATCKTHDEAVDELTKAMDKKISKLNIKNDDYTLRINQVKDPKKYQNQDPSSYDVTYQLSVTVINKNKKLDEIDNTNLAGVISELYKEKKIDRIQFELGEDKSISLADTLKNIKEENYTQAIQDMIIQRFKNLDKFKQFDTLGDMIPRQPGVKLSKDTCDNQNAYIWISIPFKNAIVNEVKDIFEAQDITLNKNAEVNWKDGVKIKDSVADKQGYQGHIEHATVTDESNRDTKTAGEKLGKIKLKFSDDTELTLDNQKLIVKEDKKAEENNNKENNKEKEQIPQIKDKENNKFDRYDRYDRNDKNNKNDKHDRNDKYDKKQKTDKNPKKDKNIESEEKQEKKQEKMDYGILAPAQALRLVQHTDLPQGEKGEATRELLARGVLSGVSDTKFKGKLAINRAMLAQVLMSISKDKSVGLIDYEDIKGDEWYADAMTWALTHGIYKGYPDKTVKATQKITRQEFASVIYNFIKEHNINMPKIKNFNYKDQDQIAPWALDAVKHLDEIGLVSGENMENYNAKDTYTREELALTIYKIIKFIENK